MTNYTFSLYFNHPILLAGVGNGDENSAQTMFSIPGAVIRGTLIAEYMRNHSITNILKDEIGETLFFSGACRFLNAYPEIRQIRTLPTPLSWFNEKNINLEDEPTVFDLGLNQNSLLAHPEHVGEEFCRLVEDADEAEMYTPEIFFQSHIAGDERGIVKSDSNVIFNYQSINSGLKFKALIVCDDDFPIKCKSALENILYEGKTLRVGGSRSASYGLVTVSSRLQMVNKPETFSGDLEDFTTVTFLSDAILREKNGQFTTNLDEILEEKLGKPGLKHKKAFIRTGVTGGFNRKWQLPLPQSQTVQAGSVFVYAATDVVPDDLTDFEQKGVGDRTIDGFGRLAVNWPGLEVLTIRPIIRAQDQVTTITLSSSSVDIATNMANRIFRSQLDNLIIEKASKFEISNCPSSHQLARLRAVIRKEIYTEQKDLDKVQSYFDDTYMRETARKLFLRARISNPRQDSSDTLIHWIIDRLRMNDVVNNYFGITRDTIPDVADEQADFSEEIKKEYTLRFLDAILYNAMLKNRKEN